jgi:hypothetical protein
METIRRKGVEYLAEKRKGKLVPVEFANLRAAKHMAEELGPEWYPVLRSQYATYADFSLPESKRSGGARVARAENSTAILAAREVQEPTTLDELLHIHGYPNLSQIREKDDTDESHLLHMQQIEDRIEGARRRLHLPFEPCRACGERRLGCWSGDGLTLCVNQPRFTPSSNDEDYESPTD